MISVNEAVAIIRAHSRPLSTECVTLQHAAGRVLREDIVSSEMIPPFDNSAVDGFAVKASDLQTASASNPIGLRLTGVVGAGKISPYPLNPGETIQVMTGAPLPQGTEAVVMIEQTTRVAENQVEFMTVPKAGENCRRAGEDVGKSQKVLTAGFVLRPFDIGMCASIGKAELVVSKRPRVAIIATGDELVEPGQPLTEGQIRASTGYALRGLIESAGAEPVDFGIVRDSVEETRRALEDALSCDLVLTCGGVSMGEFDYVRSVMEELNIRIHFWKVRQRPGKPLVFGTRDRTLFFGLPGNPVSSLLCFEIYVRESIRLLLGLETPVLKRIKAKSLNPISSKRGLHQFVRVTLESRDGSWYAVPLAKQSSGVLSSLASAHGLLEIPEDHDDVKAGETADVILLHPDAVLEQL